MIDLQEFTNKITYDVEKISEMSSVIDFFETLGIRDRASKIDVTKVAMNYDDKMLLHDAMIKNNKKSNRHKVAWEWLMYSPESSKEIPSGEVWYKDDYREE